MNIITESEIEQIAIDHLIELGYKYIPGPYISPDGEHPERKYDEVVLAARLRDAVDRLNPSISHEAQEDAVKKVLRAGGKDLLSGNETFHRYLTEGVDVEIREKDGLRGKTVLIADFENPENNEFLVINQLTVIENNQNKRPDIVLYINGLPLVVMELKNPIDETADIKSAFNQLQTYMQTIPSLFTYNTIAIASDGLDAKSGTITSDWSRFMSWKTKDGKTTADNLTPQMDVMFHGMLNKQTLMDMIRHFIVFEKDDKKTLKKVAAYHQYFAVNKAVEETLRAVKPSPPAPLPEGEGGKPSTLDLIQEGEGGANYRGGLFFAGLIKEARELRKKQTKAEEFLWEMLRNRKFMGLKFRRQHQIGEYIVDFYCDEHKLIIELDGEVHVPDKQKKHDKIRDKYLTTLGNKVLRFANEIVFDSPEDVLEMVKDSLSPYEFSSSLPTSPYGRGAGGEGNADRRIGVIWHTQGSGKSLSMVFYAGKLILNEAMNNPTIVVLTDRNDLDDQLFGTFFNCRQLLRQEPKQAESRGHLRTLLNRDSGGVIFTTIQKFMPEEADVIQDENSVHEQAVQFIGAGIKALSDRKNIIVIADEAHRSQYDFIDGYAKHMRDALPNAAFIGFTGTPIEIGDRNTQAVFGNYIDIYDIQQAVDDKCTVSIYYESRLAKMNFDDKEKPVVDEHFEEVTEHEEVSRRRELRARWTRLEAIVGSQSRIDRIASDLVTHFEDRSAVMDGKAMVVCMSRRICVEMYNAIIKLRPDWHSDDDKKGNIKVIMTGSSDDEHYMQPHIRNKAKRKAIGERLKNPADSLKMVIVRDMWLTGFDAPCLHTLYVDKPMRGHGLMQAIARVNRVFTEDKIGGLVVDYIGIAQELKHALTTYTASGGAGKPTLDQELAVAKMLEYYEAVEYQLKAFDWKKFFTLTPAEKLRYIPVILDYIYTQENGEQIFIDNTSKLIKTFAISVPHEKAMAVRDNIALFQALRTRLIKISERNESQRSGEVVDTAIKQIISEAVTADKVIDVFDAAGIKKPNIEILDERFMEELRNMPQKNIAVELLKRLLKDEVKKRAKINLVESRKFSEMLEDAIKRYHNGMIDTVEFLEKVLIPFAAQIKESDRRGEKLGLDFREYAFYTALEVSNSAVAVLGDEVLKQIAQELLKTVRGSTTIDWTIKESVQSALRRNVRRILRLHGYPPDLQEKAVDTVLTQAKLMAENLLSDQE